MKKLIALSLALIMTLALTGCGTLNKKASAPKKDSDPTSSNAVTSEESETPENPETPETPETPENSVTSETPSQTTSSKPSGGTNSSKPTHTHTYTNSVTKAATCTADGVRTYKCSGCSDSYTEKITKLGHDYKKTVTAPTCTAQGYTTHKCNRCSDTKKDTYTAAKGHNFKSTGTVTTTVKCEHCAAALTQANNMVDFYAVGDTAYWKDGELHVQYLLVNTYDQACVVTGLTNYYFETGSGQRISDTLTTTGLTFTIKANSAFIVNFTIEAKYVKNYGVTLSNVSMGCQSITKYFA